MKRILESKFLETYLFTQKVLKFFQKVITDGVNKF